MLPVNMIWKQQVYCSPTQPHSNNDRTSTGLLCNRWRFSEGVSLGLICLCGLISDYGL